ncbi:hypothetical protein FF1_018917 [Malus domestica]
MCGKKDHVALECFHRGNYVYQGQPSSLNLNAMIAQHTSQFNPNDAWVVDTGAIHHMTAEVNSLTQVQYFEGSNKITVGNGTYLNIKNISSASIRTNDYSLVLKHVLHVPKIAKSLLSVKQLYANWFIYDESQFFVLDKKTREILYHGKSRPHELFQIPVIQHGKGMQFSCQKLNAYLGQLVKSSLWHQRLGDPSNEVMVRMLKQSNVLLESDIKHNVCTSCLRKMTRLPFSSKVFSSKVDRCRFPFEKVHSDVCGPSPVKSLEGYRYYVIFVDEYTRYVWIYPMCNKSDVFQLFMQFYNYVHTQFGIRIKSFQFDGGGEFTSRSFSQFLVTKGIEHMISCPYTPQQNGIAERKHRHIVEIAITMLNDAGLSLQFWYFACAHSVFLINRFLINRMPCQSLSMHSPYKMLYDKLPDVSSLRIFGLAVYPWIRPYNSNKLQVRSAMCVFLGYSMGYKGVICFNIQT